MKKLLVFPGGGAMGIYQAMVLQHVPNLAKVDATVGTSIGSMFAVGVAQGNHRDYVEMFLANIGIIFGGYWWRHYLSYPLPRYSSTALEGVLRTFFQTSTLADCVRPCWVVSGKVRDKHPKVFSSCDASDRQLPAWRVVRASMAAPSFFSQFDLENNGRLYTDGGMFANNPVMVGVAGLVKEHCIPPSDVSAFKIGTGVRATTVSDAADKDLRTYTEALQLVAGALFDGASDVMHDTIATTVLGKPAYHIADFVLPSKYNMDDPASAKRIYEQFKIQAKTDGERVRDWLDS